MADIIFIFLYAVLVGAVHGLDDVLAVGVLVPKLLIAKECLNDPDPPAQHCFLKRLIVIDLCDARVLKQHCQRLKLPLGLQIVGTRRPQDRDL